MKFPIVLFAILVACAIQANGYSRTDGRIPNIQKRQATNADQMVQNILQWLQGAYSQNSRRIRQGTFREYLPPSHTEKPRPFQPGYPPAGYTPEPPFPFPTNPATGGITAPGGFQSEGGDDGLAPPEQGSGGGEKPATERLPGSTTTFQPNERPTEKGVPSEEPGYPTGQPSYTTGQPSYTTSQPTLPTLPGEEQPGPFPTHPGSVPEGGQSTTASQPGGPGPFPTQPEAGPSIVTGYPTTSQPGEPSSLPIQPGTIPEGGPSVTTGYPTTSFPGGPSPFPTHSGSVPEGEPAQPGYTETTPGTLFTSRPVSTLGHEQTYPHPFTSPEGTHQPPQEGTTGYPAPEQPQFTPGLPTIQPEQGGSGDSTFVPIAPGSTSLPIEPGTTEAPSGIDSKVSTTPEQPASPEGTIAPEGPGPAFTNTPGSTLPTAGSSVPSGFTTSTPSAPSESGKSPEGTTVVAESEAPGTTLSPEANTIPGPGKQEPAVVDDEDLKHPPHIHAIDVQCSKEMMTINIEFNREFNGVIYSKGYYSTPECRYVQENTGQSKYTFTVNLEMCGTEFINAFDTQNQSYLENVLVLQNEPGIQEVWDTVRSVRCLWEGNLKDTLSVAFSIGMLSQEIVTFSGDTAMAKLDVVLGRGPFGEPANGLVKIGEQMTLVVSVSGDPGFDLQVKDCKAVDSQGKNSVALTDEDGCILKPKLFGAFQKTRDTGNTGASIIAYAYFNAFKFPDEMDLMIECNIELCKTDCDMCSKEGQQLEPAKRRRRDVSYNSTASGDWITMGKLVRVILPEDLNQKTALEVSTKDHICMTTASFVFSSAILVSLLVVISFTSVCLWMKRREKMYLKY